MELEAEVAKLKEENDELQRKQVITNHILASHLLISYIHFFYLLIVCLMFLQARIMEMQKNQVTILIPLYH